MTGSFGFPGASTEVGLPSIHAHACLAKSWTWHGLHSFVPKGPVTLSPNSLCLKWALIHFTSELHSNEHLNSVINQVFA